MTEQLIEPGRYVLVKRGIGFATAVVAGRPTPAGRVRLRTWSPGPRRWIGPTYRRLSDVVAVSAVLSPGEWEEVEGPRAEPPGRDRLFPGLETFGGAVVAAGKT